MKTGFTQRLRKTKIEKLIWKEIFVFLNPWVIFQSLSAPNLWEQTL